MIKKRILLLLNLLLIPAAYALTPESLLQTYLDFYGWFDFMAYLLIFIGASKLAIEKAFKKTGEESKSISLLYTGLGLLFSLSLVTWEIKSGFYLFQLGPLVLLLLGILIIAWIWRLFKSKKEGEKRSARVSMRYIAIFFLLLIISIYAIFPEVLYYYYWSNWIKEALAILMVICGLVIIFSYASSEEEGEKGGKGKPGETWWERRKAKREKENREREELESAISAKEREDARRKAERDAIREEQLAEEKRLRELRIEDEKRRRVWRIEDEERKKKQRLKDIEENKKQEKEERERAKRAAIEAIGKIKCSIKLSSRLQGKIIDRKDISLNDEVHVEAIVTNTSGKIKYIWTIQNRKLETSNFDIIAKRMGVGKQGIELKVEDLVTGHTSKDNTTITIKEKTKTEKEIEKENLPKLDVKITGEIFKKNVSGGGLTRRGFLQNGSTIEDDEELIASPNKKSGDYEITWVVSRGSIIKNIPIIKSGYVDIKRKGEVLTLTPNDFNKPGKKIITLKVKEKSTGREVKDSIKIDVKKIVLTKEEKEAKEQEKRNVDILHKIEDMNMKIDEQKEIIPKIYNLIYPHTKHDVQTQLSIATELNKDLEYYKKLMDDKRNEMKEIERIGRELRKKMPFIQFKDAMYKEGSKFKDLKYEVEKNRMESFAVATNRIKDIDKLLNEQKTRLKELDELISNL